MCANCVHLVQAIKVLSAERLRDIIKHCRPDISIRVKGPSNGK